MGLIFTGNSPIFVEPPSAKGILPVASFNRCTHVGVISLNEFATEVEVKPETEEGLYPNCVSAVAPNLRAQSGHSVSPMMTL